MTDVTHDLDQLYRPVFAADLLVDALTKNPDAPAVNIGDRTMTAREMRDQVSRYAQALRSKGIGAGSQATVLALNRPEVLFTMAANQVNATRATPLHPMGSLEDQAYVVADCGAETLIYDPDHFTGRARELAEMVPALKNLLALGPTDFGEDLHELGSRFEPGPLVAPVVDGEDVAGIGYSGGTTGKPKGIMSTYRNGAAMTNIQMAEWQWPDEVRFLICTPLSHAGAAFFTPTLLKGGSLTVLPGFDPETFMQCVEAHRITATMLVPTMLYVLLDHPRFDAYDLSSLQTVFYGASAASPHPAGRGRAPDGPDLLPVLRPGRVPHGDHVAAQGGPRPRRLGPPGQLWAPDPVGAPGPARRRRERGRARRARRDLRAGPAGDEGLPPQARADRRGLRPRVAAHR